MFSKSTLTSIALAATLTITATTAAKAHADGEAGHVHGEEVEAAVGPVASACPTTFDSEWDGTVEFCKPTTCGTRGFKDGYPNYHPNNPKEDPYLYEIEIMGCQRR